MGCRVVSMLLLVCAGAACAMQPSGVPRVQPPPKVPLPDKVAPPERVPPPETVPPPESVTPPEAVTPPESVPPPERVAPPQRITIPGRLPAYRTPTSPTYEVPQGGGPRGPAQAAGLKRYIAIPDRGEINPRAGANRDAAEAAAAAPGPVFTPEPDPAPPPISPSSVTVDVGEGAPDDALDAVIRTHLDAWPGLEASIVVEDLAGKRHAEAGLRTDIYPASLARLAMVVAALQAIETHALKGDRLVSWDVPRNGRNARLGAPLHDAIRTAARGDLGAANGLLDLLGPDAITRTMRDLGLTGTRVERAFNRPAKGLPPNRMPAVDVARLLWRAGRGELAPAVAAGLRDVLARAPGDRGLAAVATADRTALVAGVQGSASMQDGAEVAHDAALVSGRDRSYVVVIMTRYEGDAWPFVTALALAIDRAMAQAARPSSLR